MRLILMGPPGSGKEIQGAMLSEKIGVPYVIVENMRQALRKRRQNV